MKTLSVCTPCFNEIGNIYRCYETVKRIFAEELPGYQREHIFSDNCSTDGTVEALRNIAASDTCVKVIFNARNFGIVRSSVNGIFSSSGDATFMFLPADLQDPPELMPKFVSLWEQGYEVVYGTRERRDEPKYMIAVRKSYYFLLSKLSTLSLPSNLSDFQLLDRRIINAMMDFDDAYPFVRAMPFLCSSRTIGVPYNWNKRMEGVSKNRLVQLTDQGLNGIVSTTHVPTRMALLFGFLISACMLIYAMISAAVSFVAPVQETIPGVRTLIVGMFLFNGIILFFLGVVGEYILAIHQQVRRPPRVVERERLNFAQTVASDFAQTPHMIGSSSSESSTEHP